MKIKTKKHDAVILSSNQEKDILNNFLRQIKNTLNLLYVNIIIL